MKQILIVLTLALPIAIIAGCSCSSNNSSDNQSTTSSSTITITDNNQTEPKQYDSLRGDYHVTKIKVDSTYADPKDMLTVMSNMLGSPVENSDNIEYAEVDYKGYAKDLIALWVESVSSTGDIKYPTEDILKFVNKAIDNTDICMHINGDGTGEIELEVSDYDQLKSDYEKLGVSGDIQDVYPVENDKTSINYTIDGDNISFNDGEFTGKIEGDKIFINSTEAGDIAELGVNYWMIFEK